MISLEQIKKLENRVHGAVGRIRSLTAENETLKDRLSTYEKRVADLEGLVSAFKSEQQEIEAGIIAALEQLDGLEDAVSEASSPSHPAGAPGETGDPSATGTADRGQAATRRAEDPIANRKPVDPPIESEADPDEPPAGSSQALSEPVPSADDPTPGAEDEPELDIF